MESNNHYGQFKSLFENNIEATYMINDHKKFTLVNKKTEELTGFSRDQLLDMTFDKLIIDEDISFVINAYYSALSGNIEEFDCRLLRSDNKTIEIRVKIFPVDLNRSEMGIWGIAKDISTIKNMQSNKDFYKHLTLLPGRDYIYEYFKKIFPYEIEKEMGCLFIDIDHFSEINDYYGYEKGDQLLTSIAKNLRNSVRPKDIVVHDSRDKFIIILKGIGQNKIDKIIDRIKNSIEKSYLINNNNIYISVSIGISTYTNSKNNVDKLLKNANAAMNFVKKLGGNNYLFYSSELDDNLKDKIKMQSDIIKGIKNSEFMVYYQPQVDIKTEKIIGLEALARWKHPDYGFISPDKFIRLAEERNLINYLGKYLADYALKEFKKLLNLNNPNLKLAINFSRKQLYDSNFIDEFIKLVNKYNIPYQNLEIEITESMIMKLEFALPILLRLKKLGIKIAFDDFGTGYSSLSLLGELPLDSLKIDATFMKNIGQQNKKKNLLKIITDLGHNFDLLVLAEGVEHKYEVDYLEKIDCDQVQGYYYSKPKPFVEMKKILKNSKAIAGVEKI